MAPTRHRATRAYVRETLGLLLMLVGLLGFAACLSVVFGWLTIPLLLSVVTALVGWSIASRTDAGTGTSPGTSTGTGTGTSGPELAVIEIDTDNLDPGSFVPGR